MAKWDTAKYLEFERERTQPAIDLMMKVSTHEPKKIIDIGCGPGNSTAVLHGQYPDAELLGVDSSEEMIDKAEKSYPYATFRLCDAGTQLPSLGNNFDFVFSNACIQWIPNHEKLIPDMLGLLKPGGVLAVQVPMNGNSPLYRLIEEIASEEKWGFEDVELEVNEILSPGEYFDILSELSASFSIWETVYYHKMPSHQSLIDWVKGTRLRPYLNVLSNEGKQAFERELLTKVKKLYPAQKSGEIIFRFRRLFFTATAK